MARVVTWALQTSRDYWTRRRWSPSRRRSRPLSTITAAATRLSWYPPCLLRSTFPDWPLRSHPAPSAVSPLLQPPRHRASLLLRPALARLLRRQGPPPPATGRPPLASPQSLPPVPPTFHLLSALALLQTSFSCPRAIDPCNSLSAIKRFPLQISQLTKSARMGPGMTIGSTVTSDYDVGCWGPGANPNRSPETASVPPGSSG